MASQGSIISSADYNAVVDQIILILGSGKPNGPGTTYPNYGYNQAVQSQYVTPGTTITAYQWLQVQNDLGRIYLHQNGTSYAFPTLASKQLITYSDLSNLSPILSSVTSMPNTVALNQLTQQPLSTIVYGSPWGGGAHGITTSVSVTFASAVTFQYFLNQGGKIVIQGTGPTLNGSKQTEFWQHLLDNFSYTLDLASWQNLLTNGSFTPGSFSRVYSLSSSYDAAYSSNYASIDLRYDNLGTVYFNVTFFDSHTGTQDLVNSGAGFIIYQYSASGAFTGYTATAYSKDTTAWTLL